MINIYLVAVKHSTTLFVVPEFKLVPIPAHLVGDAFVKERCNTHVHATSFTSKLPRFDWMKPFAFQTFVFLVIRNVHLMIK